MKYKINTLLLQAKIDYKMGATVFGS